MQLHSEKIKILSRLVKNDSITLEEALTLLKEESVDNQHNMKSIASNDSIICTTVTDSSTWNTSYSYAKYDETPTI